MHAAAAVLWRVEPDTADHQRTSRAAPHGDAAEGFRRGAEQAVTFLTARQREVAGLLARGLSNAEIAERLVLTQGTVANHVEHILRRLGFSSRTQVAVWAAERGLQPPRDAGEQSSSSS